MTQFDFTFLVSLAGFVRWLLGKLEIGIRIADLLFVTFGRLILGWMFSLEVLYFDIAMSGLWLNVFFLSHGCLSSFTCRGDNALVAESSTSLTGEVCLSTVCRSTSIGDGCGRGEACVVGGNGGSSGGSKSRSMPKSSVSSSSNN